MAARELKTFTNLFFFSMAVFFWTVLNWYSCFNVSEPLRSRFREINLKRKWWRNLIKRWKSRLRKSIAGLIVTTAAQYFCFWKILNMICLAIKAFFWSIQLGGDIKRFATWNMCRFSQLFNGLPKWDGWRSLKSG